MNENNIRDEHLTNIEFAIQREKNEHPFSSITTTSTTNKKHNPAAKKKIRFFSLTFLKKIKKTVIMASAPTMSSLLSGVSQSKGSEVAPTMSSLLSRAVRESKVELREEKCKLFTVSSMISNVLRTTEDEMERIVQNCKK